MSGQMDAKSMPSNSPRVPSVPLTETRTLFCHHCCFLSNSLCVFVCVSSSMDDLRDSCLVDCAQKAVTVVYKCLYKCFLGVFSFLCNILYILWQSFTVRHHQFYSVVQVQVQRINIDRDRVLSSARPQDSPLILRPFHRWYRTTSQQTNKPTYGYR